MKTDNYSILKYAYYKKDIEMFKSETLLTNPNKTFYKIYGHQVSYKYLHSKRDSVKKWKNFKKIFDENKWEIKKLLKPTTFPKYSIGEILRLYREKGSVEHIRWNGKEWEYQLKNIGHLGLHLPESKFNKNYE